jgi:hypothetical protein
MTRTPRRAPLTADDVTQALTDLRLIVDALRLPVRYPGRGKVSTLEIARTRATAFAPGVRAAGLEGSRSSTVSDPTGAAVVAIERRTRPPGTPTDPDGNHERHAGWRTDPTEWWAIELGTLTRAVVTLAGRLADLVTAINAHADPDIDSQGRRRPTLGAGLCLACDHNAPGTATDRLRGGLCDSCRKREARAGHPDRTTFVRVSRHERQLPPLHPDTERDRTATITEEATP